jgi:hypothetical protein
MLQHYIQREIVRSLTFSEGARFSELKPEGVENKLFDYHLKITIRDGYVQKDAEGAYSLTVEGRRLGSRNFNNPATIADSAYSVLFLVVRRASDNAWLLYRRKTHPVIGKVGFMHALPTSESLVVESAQNQTKLKTDLDCVFTALGGGFIKTHQGKMLEGHVNFSLLYCNNAQGDLKNQDQFAEYFWQTNPDFSSDNMIPNMPLLASLYEKGETFFVDETVQF